MVAEGHEIGAHTFSHPELTDLPGWRRDLELLADPDGHRVRDGRRTSLLRPPYSSSPDALDDARLVDGREAAGRAT